MGEKGQYKTHINAITQGDVTSGEVLSTVDVNGTIYALIIGKGNKYFINGDLLDQRQASLSQIS
jgi:hypothetical protein